MEREGLYSWCFCVKLQKFRAFYAPHFFLRMHTELEAIVLFHAASGRANAIVLSRYLFCLSLRNGESNEFVDINLLMTSSVVLYDRAGASYPFWSDEWRSSMT